MTNPLYDQLFGIHAGKDTPFLYLPDGTTLTHAAFLARASRFANALTHLGSLLKLVTSLSSTPA